MIPIPRIRNDCKSVAIRYILNNLGINVQLGQEEISKYHHRFTLNIVSPRGKHELIKMEDIGVIKVHKKRKKVIYATKAKHINKISKKRVQNEEYEIIKL
jgi:hypothetical protein